LDHFSIEKSYWLRWDPEFRVIAKTNENIKNYIQKLRKQNTELEQKVKKLMKAKTDESSLQQQPQQQQSSQSQFQPESIRLREDSVTTPSNFYFELV
jgi:type II secretory pathway component PulM